MIFKYRIVFMIAYIIFSLETSAVAGSYSNIPSLYDDLWHPNTRVYDADTGLIWSLQLEIFGLNPWFGWAFALIDCNNMNEKMPYWFSYGQGLKYRWRLPNIKELLSLVEYEKKDPVIDTGFFPGVKAGDVFWSSTSSRRYPSRAFAVRFDRGAVVVRDKVKQLNKIKCVRTKTPVGAPY